MNHTSNPIDVKIWLQFTLIEEYFSGFIFDMRSTFKGRFQSFSCKNLWLSCFNGCGIEFRKQENHEELKIFLQNHLISSRFNQKLSYKDRRTLFYKKFSMKNVDRLFRDEIWAIGSRKISGIVAHDADFTLIDFHRPIFIETSL